MRKAQRLIITFYLMMSTSVAQADNLRIAVAANFYTTANLIKQEFEKLNNHTLTFIRGSTGKLFAQIKHGAPYDVFLAADVKRPEILEREKLIIHGSRKTYAIGQLALWTKQEEQNPFEVLSQGRFRKLAIANPKIAPYGQAAVEILQQHNLYTRVKNRLVYGENIAQVFQFVQSGSADIGFVALSHVKSISSSYWLAPVDNYQKLEQQLVILGSSKKPELAKKFVNFMLRDDTKKLIREQGYETL